MKLNRNFSLLRSVSKPLPSGLARNSRACPLLHCGMLARYRALPEQRARLDVWDNLVEP